MSYYCNPINMPYKYQFNLRPDETISVSREAADPSMICFQGRYYIFPSMTCGFIYSDDCAVWTFHPLKNLPAYDYAPDVHVVGDYVYFCASSHEYGRFYRTKDLFSHVFETIEFPFPFWDPALFHDDDGRMYLYWGCGSGTPINGVELDPTDLKPISEIRELICADEDYKGFERRGENHREKKPDPDRVKEILNAIEARSQGISDELKKTAIGHAIGLPYIEGAWMTKYQGKYYLQYAAPGAESNVYNDGVYIGDRPLGPFEMAANNPFSYKPGGFIPGAGHGSTMVDMTGNYWHTSTMRISVNHNFERRIGLWPVGFDRDGEMFCNQRFGDWPYNVAALREDPWSNPEWMLLSYGKAVQASSFIPGKEPEKAVDENIRSWWRAETAKSGEWLAVDLGQEMSVHAVQINFADDGMSGELPPGAQFTGSQYLKRFIDEVHQPTRWKLEGSVDGTAYFTISNKSNVDTDLAHDLVVMEKGIGVRFIRLTVVSLPYGQSACVSGLRVFGLGTGKCPDKAARVICKREGALDMTVNWDGDGLGYVVLWGYRADRLYHSYQVFEHQVEIGGLVKDQAVYVRVDSFNENGITCGDVIQL